MSLWLVKEVTPTVDVVTSWFKQSKNGQSKNTTRTDAKNRCLRSSQIRSVENDCPAKQSVRNFPQIRIPPFPIIYYVNFSTQKWCPRASRSSLTRLVLNTKIIQKTRCSAIQCCHTQSKLVISNAYHIQSYFDLSSWNKSKISNL